MAITNIGFAGPVAPQDWYNLTMATNTIYGVDTVAGLNVTPKSGSDRTVSVAPGSAWGRGIYTTSTATESVTLPTITSGSRWDLIVLRRDWNTKASTFTYVKGGANKGLPTRNTAVGVLDDQPIALVRVEAGKTAVQEVADMRCWGHNGGLVVRDEFAMDYLMQPGTRVVMGNQEFFYGTNGAWGRRAANDDTGWVSGTFLSGWGKGASGYLSCRRAAIGQGHMVQVKVRFERTGGTIDVPNSGDIGNVIIGRVPAGFEPWGGGTGMTSGAIGRMAAGSIETNGNIQLTSVVQGVSDVNIVKGHVFSLYATYFTD